MEALDRFVERYGKQRYLAFSLFIYFLVDAFVEGNAYVTFGVLTTLIVTGPLAVGERTWLAVTATGLALVMVTLGLVSAARDSLVLYELSLVVGTLFFGVLIYVFSHRLLFGGDSVTEETLWAAVNVYVLIGFLFAFLYALADILVPGAFTGGALENTEYDRVQMFLYFSYVTMTTLGYGDISPNAQVTFTLAYLQALIGQLYVAILIARLVSMYAGPRRR